jgi:ribosome-interacting GTPase 1
VTNADSKVGNYDFTTLGVVPGMMEYKGVKMQILDLPGIIEGAASGKGFGRKVLSVIRAADLIVLMTDVGRVAWLAKMRTELENAGIRLNQIPPKIYISRLGKGAIRIIDSFKSLNQSIMTDIAKEMGYENAIIQLGEKIESVERYIDGLSKSRRYMPLVEVVTKVDQRPRVKRQEGVVYISVESDIGIKEFREAVWRGLGLIRVYLKHGRTVEADRQEPLIMKKGQTLDDVLKRVSREMRDDVGRAFIWGTRAKFPGQEVSFSYPLFDEMAVWFGR